MIKLLADQKIPGIRELFADNFTLKLLDDYLIHPDILQGIDVLITRTTIPINQALLQNSSIKLVASPTSGIDHMDVDWLTKNNISYTNASGCNAHAVADYVVCSIAALQQQGLLNNKRLRAGVIGVGHVGSRVVERLSALGFEVLQNDPPRAERDPSFYSTPIEKFKELDLICLHTPLTYQGRHPTYQLIEKNFLQQQKENCVLLNAGRGAVINETDLLNHGKHLRWCLDVFENEPRVNTDIIAQSTIVTPHIAGYSQQAKWRGTLMIYLAICEFFKMLPEHSEIENMSLQRMTIDTDSSDWQKNILKIFDPRELTHQLKQSNNSETFLKLRNNYPLRTELSCRSHRW